MKCGHAPSFSKGIQQALANLAESVKDFLFLDVCNGQKGLKKLSRAVKVVAL